MALVVNNGIVSNDNSPWVDYFILNSELTTVYRLFLNELGELRHEAVLNAVEKNEQLLDGVTGDTIRIRITEDILYFDNVDTGLKQHTIEIENTLTDMEDVEDSQTDTLNRLSNGWKVIE